MSTSVEIVNLVWGQEDVAKGPEGILWEMRLSGGSRMTDDENTVNTVCSCSRNALPGTEFLSPPSPLPCSNSFWLLSKKASLLHSDLSFIKSNYSFINLLASPFHKSSLNIAHLWFLDLTFFFKSSCRIKNPTENQQRLKDIKNILHPWLSE